LTQGTHQVAQKLRRTTLSAAAALSLTARPSRPFRVKSGALWAKAAAGRNENRRTAHVTPRPPPIRLPTPGL